MKVWICWKASEFDTAQVCRHDGCGWSIVSDLPQRGGRLVVQEGCDASCDCDGFKVVWEDS